MYLVTSEQMQALDKRTIDSLRVSGIILMEHAGRAVAQEVIKYSPGRVVILCGKGNNGGDGWITARWLHLWGVPDVLVVTIVAPSALKGDAVIAADMALAAGIPYMQYGIEDEIPAADLYVDALLGTGTTRPLNGLIRTLTDGVTATQTPVVAVDIATGVNASTGEVYDGALRAQVTVCMGAQKLGTAVWPGADYAGEVQVADIGIPMGDTRRLAKWIVPEEIADYLPVRGNSTHKGTYGRVGIAVGQMHGAAILAGLGAARIGTGLIVLAAVTDLHVNVPYEFVLRSPGYDDSDPSMVLADCRAIAVGPGLGQQAGLWKQVVDGHLGKGVLDADGLILVNGLIRPEQWVLTPHPKECARLLGWTTQAVQANRVAAARQLAIATGTTVILKGYRSIIADPAGALRVNPTGDATLATAGTGDVLAGVVAGLLAQGLSPIDAASAGAWIHGRAGELAGQTGSKVSAMASDVVEHISRAIRLHFDRGIRETQ